ncbi:hypothetical protein M3G04_02355 [Dietzia cinnamea]|uniref:hypothetical protein n=1 Tax=Dietzia cinnamea TaxID=321318 RepID=UPI00223B18E7|nr:hypothetical protein [Dietzia cinnamea]MCT2299752.1 hypothetical protein [Dietzia cinnamea]
MAKVFLSHWEERLPDGRWVMHRPGEEVAVTGDVLARLESIGAVGEPTPAPAPQPVAATEPEEVPVGTSDRPLKTAKLEAWQAYARSVGVNVTGKSKAEIIAAVG